MNAVPESVATIEDGRFGPLEKIPVSGLKILVLDVALPCTTRIFPLAAPLSIGITNPPFPIPNVIVAAVLNGIGQVAAS